MNIRELFELVGTAGWIGWVVVGIHLLLQFVIKRDSHVLKSYQAALDDMGSQIEDLRRWRAEDNETHRREILAIHEAHNREMGVVMKKHEECEEKVRELNRVLVILRQGAE